MKPSLTHRPFHHLQDDNDAIAHLKPLPSDDVVSLKRMDLLGGLHHLKSPTSKRFVQEQASNTPMVSVYTKPLASSEIKKVTKTKLIKMHMPNQNKSTIGDVIDHKILWEPESEPLNETVVGKSKS